MREGTEAGVEGSSVVLYTVYTVGSFYAFWCPHRENDATSWKPAMYNLPYDDARTSDCVERFARCECRDTGLSNDN